MKKLLIYILPVISLSCNKEWLNESSDRSKIIPSTLEDFQALLTNERLLNMQSGFLEEAGTDNYYLSDESFDALLDEDKNLYTWNKDIFARGTSQDWNNRYQRVYIANAVLEGLNRLKENQGSSTNWKTLRGTALFFRANALFNIAQGFAAPYVENTALPGIPLRKGSDVSERITRSSLEETYSFILSDLSEASSLLPGETQYKTMPAAIAAEALLARIYLSMNKYNDAFTQADNALSQYALLQDYSIIDSSAYFPFLRFNEEVIWEDQSVSPDWFYTDRCKIDSILMSSYHENDLRKSLYFLDNGDGSFSYRGSYDGGFDPFTGLAVDELFLIRAECFARKGETENALSDLNTLLKKRWRPNTFVPFEANSPEEVLDLILAERRKELIFRNTRWSDLRRLNQQPGKETTLVRKIHGNVKVLDGNSPNYVLPIPPDVISVSGIQQNSRVE